MQNNVQKPQNAQDRLRSADEDSTKSSEMDNCNFVDADDQIFDDEEGDSLGNEWGVVDVVSMKDADHNDNHTRDIVIGINAENNVNRNAGINENEQMDEMEGQRCWICDECNAINNLMETLKSQNMRCCRCSFLYYPNATIIYSNDWDVHIDIV